jgi:hypothetical protein
MTLSISQQEFLLQPINPNRVQQRDGMSHLEAWDVRRTLIRVFGHTGFSVDTIDLELLYEQSKEGDPPRWRAAYRATVRLEVNGATYTESASGTNMGWLPDSKRDEAHDMAIKTATSQALKRCATNLGDQFGLSLYNKGRHGAVVGNTLPYRDAVPHAEPPSEVPHADDPKVEPEENDPTTETAETAQTGPAPDTTPTPDPSDLEQQLLAAAKIADKSERTRTVTRLGIEASKAKAVQSMTSRGVTISTLVDRAFAGEVA